MPKIEEALRLAASGLSIIPTTLKDKKPCENPPFPMRWKRWQSEIASEDQIRNWWAQDLSLAIVAGSVSGNLEMIDFDYRAEFAKKWREIVVQNAPGLFEKLVVQRTQNNGRHAIYRCSSLVGRNVELTHHVSEVPDGTEHRYNDLGKPLKPTARNGKWYIRPCMIETRGEGGYFLAAPSPGYEVLQGSLTAIPTISVAERDILLRAAMALDEQFPDEVKLKVEEPVVDWNASASGQKRAWKGKSTAEDFNERFEIRDIIEKHGWQFDHSAKGNDYFTRPGKGAGVSASFNGEVFYCFTSNDPQFKSSVGYSKFQVYSILEHGGDFSAAAKKLYAEGYGDRQAARAATGAAEPRNAGTGQAKTASAPDHADDDPLEVRPEFKAPEWPEIEEAIAGTPLGVYVAEAGGIGVGVPRGFLLLDSIMLGCLVSAKVGTKVIRAAGAPQPTNIYGLKLGKSGQSKGLTSDLLLEFASAFGVYRLHGKSEAAIIKNVVKDGNAHASVGLNYVSEIAKFLDPKNPVAASMAHFWLEAFDLGYADWSTKNADCHLDEFNPSCLFLGQPSVLEDIVGARASVQTGFVPRCLMAYDSSARQDGCPRGVDKEAIKAAYHAYERHGNKQIAVPYHEPHGRMASYKPYFSEFEESIWKRLRYHYAPRIAMLLHPDSIAAGQLTPAMLDSAGPILDWFFAQAQRVGHLLNDDRGEIQRSKFERFVQEHPGCDRRDILRGLHISLKEFVDVSTTVQARGGAHEKPIATGAKQRIRWFPGPKAGTVTGKLSQRQDDQFATVKPSQPQTVTSMSQENIDIHPSDKVSLYTPATETRNLEVLNSSENNRHRKPSLSLRQTESDVGAPEPFVSAGPGDEPESVQWQQSWLELYFYLTNEGFGHEFARRTIKAQMEQMDNRSSASEATIKASQNTFLRMIDIGNEPMESEYAYQPEGELVL